MKTLGAWMAGIFILGLGLGTMVSGSIPKTETDVESAVETAPQVDCGVGREALLEPVAVDGKTSFTVRCVTPERATPSRVTPVAERPAPRPIAAPTPSPVSVESPARTPPASSSIDPDEDAEGRTWKESAVVIGGAAGAGAGIGALAKGKKGAAVGAAIGAASGAAYELIKRDQN